ncbi:MAG: ATP-binding protein [Gammaproteobacteria bacterium]|nr:ATP-binding protein [Gammaproteobacteria bacterium]
MPAKHNHGFIARADGPGLLPAAERQARLRAGVNPYEIGPALEGNSPLFLGREQVFNDLLGNLRRPGKPPNISLLGERRIGKSSLLHQLIAALEREPGLITLFGDAQHFQRSEAGEFFRHIREALESVLPGQQQGGSDYAGLRDFISGLNCRVLLILDEFEYFADNPKLDMEFFAHLRALGNDPACPLGYVLASRATLKDICGRHDHVHASNFWGIFGHEHILGLLDLQAARDLVRMPLERTLNKSISVEQADKLLRWSGHHPALIQIMMNRLWSARSGGFEPDKNAIRADLHRYLRLFWEARDASEKTLLCALAAGKKLKNDQTRLDLIRRGLLTQDGRLFCRSFENLIRGEWQTECPRRSLDERLDRTSEDITRAGSIIKKQKNAFQGFLELIRETSRAIRGLDGEPAAKKDEEEK